MSDLEDQGKSKRKKVKSKRKRERSPQEEDGVQSSVVQERIESDQQGDFSVVNTKKEKKK